MGFCRYAVGLGREGYVWIVEGKVKEEGVFDVRLNELNGLCSLGEFSLAALLLGWRRVAASRENEVESAGGGVQGFRAEVPFADAGSGVAGVLQTLRNDEAIVCESSRKGRLDQSMARPVSATRKKVGDLQPRRGLAGEQCGSGWRANGGGAIGCGESFALACELV